MGLPSTPLLDDFSRPNENPLSGKWGVLDTAAAAAECLNRTAHAVADGSTIMYWADASGFTDSEVWFQLVSTGTLVQLILRARQPGLATWDGYAVNLLSGAPGTATIRQITNGNISATLATASFTPAAGDIFVARIVGPTITVYRKVGSAIYQFLSGSDNAYTSGNIGFGLTGTTTIRNFGGGAIDSLRANTVVSATDF